MGAPPWYDFSIPGLRGGTPRATHAGALAPVSATPQARPVSKTSSPAPVVAPSASRAPCPTYLQDQEPAAPAVPLAADDLGGLPATFIATAEYDVLRDEAAEFARRLEASGVRVTLRDYEGMIHGFCWMDGVLDAAGDLQRDGRRGCGRFRSEAERA
ncbi:alpha/beta hydrolase fold domain-containing protein [Mariniluteicoccus flavus]